MAKEAFPAQPGAVERLADWVLAAPAESIPARAVTQAKLLLLDTLGCGYAALDDQCAQAVLASVDAIGGTPLCTVLGRARKTSAPNAVLANGTLVRVLDLNDYLISPGGDLGGHPSDNIPVALAIGEAHAAAGRELLAAIVVGYEIFGRCKAAMASDSAWDGTTVSGLVASAMAGRLMNLDRNRLAHALALGAARAPTPTVVRFGNISAAKSIANALIAQSGVQAAMLAAAGVTGPLDIFEHTHGLCSVFENGDAIAALTAPLAAEPIVMHAHIKAYPCLVTGHTVVAAALAMHQALDGKIEGLRRVKLSVADTPGIRRQLQDPGRLDPRSREAADHSFGFLVAVAMIDGEFGLAQFAGERWNDPKVRALMAQIEMAGDPDLTGRVPNGFPCAIHAVAADGAEHRVEVLDPPGFARGGLAADAVLGKFRSVTAGHLARDAQDRIVTAVTALDGAASCAGLIAALTPARQ
jgi:2-methylcitrate dehydratase